MRNLALVFLITLYSCGQVSESRYGEPTTNLDPISFENAISQLGEKGTVLAGEIQQTCAMKGCWMTVKLDGSKEEIRVTFKDYGFFVPKEGVERKRTIIQGQLISQETDIETLRHFAKDAGKTEEEIMAINSPKQEYSFIATGVVIQN